MDATVAMFLERYREVHRRFRAALEGFDPAILGVVPAAETSSAAALVRHSLGSQGDVLRAVAGLPSDRDRTAEFRVDAEVDPASLRAMLDAADAFLEEVGPRITAERLALTIERPPRPARTGLAWLVHNYGHVCEHLGHLELTRQVLAEPTR